MMHPLLRCVNLTKQFGPLVALQQVSFAMAPGEVVGWAGWTGAGKSVLAMLLAGLMEPSDGELYIDGRRMRWPFTARSLGIQVIHQQPDLADGLDVVENIFLGGELGWPTWAGWLKVPDRRRMEQAALGILNQLDVHLPALHTPVANLSSEQRQLVAIGRALAAPARLIIIDDPTAQLGYAAQQRLLTLIRQWQQQGVAVLFSSPNLDHLFAVADRVLVLRRGRVVGDYDTDTTSREAVVAALVGTADRQQLTPLIWALDSFYRAREQAEKLGHQQRLLEANLAARDSLNQQLIEQLAQQVTALDQVNLALQDAQRRLLTEREHERKSLARELHDQVIQDLLSLNYQLEAIASDMGEHSDELLEVHDSIRTLVDEIRRICGMLRPPTIDSLGLGAALQSYMRDWSTRTGIQLDLDLDPNLGRLPETVELSIFRIVQEALSNVWKHAQARHVRISLTHPSPRSLLMSITDDGAGLAGDFDLATLAAAGHYGLLGISERVALLGGRLQVQTGPHGGVLLQVELPHRRVEAMPMYAVD